MQHETNHKATALPILPQVRTAILKHEAIAGKSKDTKLVIPAQLLAKLHAEMAWFMGTTPGKVDYDEIAGVKIERAPASSCDEFTLSSPMAEPQLKMVKGAREVSSARAQEKDIVELLLHGAQEPGTRIHVSTALYERLPADAAARCEPVVGMDDDEVRFSVPANDFSASMLLNVSAFDSNKVVAEKAEELAKDPDLRACIEYARLPIFLRYYGEGCFQYLDEDTGDWLFVNEEAAKRTNMWDAQGLIELGHKVDKAAQMVGNSLDYWLDRLASSDNATVHMPDGVVMEVTQFGVQLRAGSKDHGASRNVLELNTCGIVLMDKSIHGTPSPADLSYTTSLNVRVKSPQELAVIFTGHQHVLRGLARICRYTSVDAPFSCFTNGMQNMFRVSFRSKEFEYVVIGYAESLLVRARHNQAVPEGEQRPTWTLFHGDIHEPGVWGSISERIVANEVIPWDHPMRYFIG